MIPLTTLSIKYSVVHSHSISEVKFFRVGSEGLAKDTWMIALLKHVEIDSLLVLEKYTFSLSVSVEGIHEHKRNIAVVFLV